ncbi:MAG: hypothetical protein KUF72_13965 [Candidatus Thiodiazotropha sp. (ex Ctena orbiculata)]|nr:hypothetical protein [Candidatus Thiodiazotropha taylori]
MSSRPMATSTTKKKAAPKAKSAAASRKKSTAKKSPSAQQSKAANQDKGTKSATENRVLPGLMQGLQSVFDKIHKDNQIREDHHEKIIEEFSDRLTTAFQQTHAEAEEREKLLQERLEAIEKEQTYKIQRIKLFSLPGTVIAVAALIYLFYVVHVMESSMTSMSADMNRIQGHIASIGQDTASMSSGVNNMNKNITELNGNMSSMTSQVKGMNSNMGHLNRNVGVMTHDVGNMSHTVSPVMNGMRNFMPF